MRTFFASILAAILLALVSGRVFAHEGPLDDAGCHYERKHGQYHCHRDVPPNPDRYAPVKKSRDNICHDRSSPNYQMLQYFVAYRSMNDCVFSGGREHLNGR